MLDVPVWFTRINRELIESAVETAFPEVFAFLTEDEAVARALIELQRVASRLPQPFPDAYQQDLDDLLAQIIVCAFNVCTSPTTRLPAFETRVRDGLGSWWPSSEPAPPGVADTPPSPAPPPLLTLEEAAEQLKLSVDTLERMGKAGTLEIIQFGKGKARRVSVTEVHRLLALPQYRYR